MSSPTMPAVTPVDTWSLSADGLVYPVSVQPVLRGLLSDYLLHRYRKLQAQGNRFLLPMDLVLTETQIQLRYRDAGLLAEAAHGGSQKAASWLDFKVHELLPVLDTICACQDEGIGGFAPFLPVRGRMVPPVSFFLPRRGATPPESLRPFLSWLEDHPQASAAKDSFLGDVRAALRHPDPLPALRSLVDAEQQRIQHLKARPSFVSVLTEAELLEFVARVYRYRVRKDLSQAGSHDLWLEVDPCWSDPHYPELIRPTPQELWEVLTEESQATPPLSATTSVPDPLRVPSRETPIVQWIGVDPSKPRLCVRYPQPDSPRIPAEGYLSTTQTGDLAVIKRKRRFAPFAGEHQALLPFLRAPEPANPMAGAPLHRAELDDAILATRGLFTVQGPPGTGKTYLATQVVMKLLRAQPGARILICAKEHFALNHILTTITAKLNDEGLAFRAYRAMSRSRLDRLKAAGEELPPFTPPEVQREVAELPFAPSAQVFSAVVATLGKDHDLRSRSLGAEAANLFFATTLDASLLDLIESTGFDLVIVEEAGKCYPSEVLHALALARCALLIGDQNQLPPYQEQRTQQHLRAVSDAIHSATREPAFGESLQGRFGPEAARLLRFTGDATEHSEWLRPFQRLYDRGALGAAGGTQQPTRFMLNEQFRMERPLSDLVGQVFYGAPFVHRKTAVSPLRGRLPAAFNVPLLWILTPPCSKVPEAAEDKLLRRSRYELQVLRGYLRQIPAGLAMDLVLLTPYNAHKDLLIADPVIDAECQRLSGLPASKLVRTTDEYQGREAELTVLSLVRNNQQQRGAFGFMTSPERLNVMFSRARYRQVVIGCADLIRQHQSEAPHLAQVLHSYEKAAADPAAARLVSARELWNHGK